MRVVTMLDKHRFSKSVLLSMFLLVRHGSNASDSSSPPARPSPVMLRCAQHLAAARDRPFASLRVTGCDCSNYQGQFVQIEPCLNDQSRYCHPERSEGSLCPSRETLRSAQGDKPFPILVVKNHYRPYTTLP